MKKQRIDTVDLRELGLEALKDFWGIENGLFESMNRKQLDALIQKARFGMQFYKEFNVNNRARESNTFRFCTLIADNKKELERLLKASLPQYVVEEK